MRSAIIEYIIDNIKYKNNYFNKHLEKSVLDFFVEVQGANDERLVNRK